MRLYASLVGPLHGLYYPLPVGDWTSAKKLLNASRLRRLWCDIYDERTARNCIERFGGVMLPAHMAQYLVPEEDDDTNQTE